MRPKDIRQLHDLLEMVQNDGVKLKGSGTTQWGICPFPDHPHVNNTPSFSVFWTGDRQRFKCHGTCGRSGDVVDYVGYMNNLAYDKTDPVQYMKACSLLDTGHRYEVSPPIVPPPTPPLPNWLADDCLPANSDTLKYLMDRRIELKQAKKFKIGQPTKQMEDEPYNLWDHKKWITLPCIHGDDLVGIKLRSRIENDTIRYLQVSGSKKGLFNFNAVNGTTENVLVLKGELAVIVADQLGFLACAPTGGEGSYITDVKYALTFANVIVVGDNDNKEFAIRRASQLDAAVAFPPPDWNGWDDWALDDINAIQTTKQWFQTLKE